MQLEAFVPIVALGLVVYTLTNLGKYVLARQWNAVLTLLVGWGMGVAAVFLFGATVWAHSVKIADTTLGDVGGWEKVVLGLVVLGTASTAYDFKRAFDRHDSAQTPPMFAHVIPKPLGEKAVVRDDAHDAAKPGYPEQ